MIVFLNPLRIIAESSTGCIFAGSSLGKKGEHFLFYFLFFFGALSLLQPVNNSKKIFFLPKVMKKQTTTSLHLEISF